MRLWSALNNEPARLAGIGEKRMVTGGGRTFPAWDFNDVDVRQARDPANKLSFLSPSTITGVPVHSLHNVWVHAADARTLFPQQDVPTSVTRCGRSSARREDPDRVAARRPARGEAQRANVTAYLFTVGTQQALAPDIAAASSGGCRRSGCTRA